jgi:hypothetical protein
VAEAQACPAGQEEHCAQLPPWQVSHAGQSVSPWHAEPQKAVVLPGSAMQTCGAVQLTFAHDAGGGEAVLSGPGGCVEESGFSCTEASGATPPSGDTA